jgi:hypothetical protein
MMNNLKIIHPGKPTEYRGIMFRSRLEVQWAYFFDQNSINWLYEPKRLRFDDGT